MNQSDSHAVSIARDGCIDAFEEAAPLAHGVHWDEFDAILILQHLDFLPRLQTKCLANFAWNDYLKLRRDGDDGHTDLIDEHFVQR